MSGLQAIDQVLRLIDGGECDDDLNTINTAIRERQKLLARRTIRTIRDGQKVRFNDTVNPTYLRGLEGTVVKVNKTNVVVLPDEHRGRFAGQIRVPANLLEVVDA